MRSFEKKFPICWEFAPSVEVDLSAVPVTFARSIPPVPSGVEVMIKVSHADDVVAEVVFRVRFEFADCAIEFLLGFAEVE